MRIDKFLKVARILKRRETGKQLAINQRLYINDRPAKAASEVKEGDMIRIVFGHREILVKVLEIRTSASKEQAFGMYEVVEEKKEEIV
ncbi:MAG: RNA-binding S4 domain-containing protein [Erysipelotrichaceae bacterium]|nr:RNA-binding S4 domain-containing protein [Erysipelotrichaceae bacterium]MBQ1534874.1 RNA-binding S4 domain-containing protein [Erysipelotrichaceae bacterium]MBQ1787819.1 RNA-binding S4 domain-containing protein [Erysipelotrichaceae bacterium]